MFSIEKGKVTDDEINDALSEMINIIGGNLKSLLPQPSQLSIPIVDKDEVPLGFPFTEQVAQVVFECLGSKFMVTIHQVADNKLQNQQSAVKTAPVSLVQYYYIFENFNIKPETHAA